MVIWLSAATATPVAQPIAVTPESAAAKSSVTPIFILHSPFFIGRANRTLPRTTFTIADRVGSYRRATERGKTGRCRLLALPRRRLMSAAGPLSEDKPIHMLAGR